MAADFLIIFFIARYLTRAFKTQTELPQWDSILKKIMVAAIVFTVVGIVFQKWQRRFDWISDGLLVYLTYIMYNRPEFSKARPYLIALLPYVVVSVVTDLIKLIAPTFYEEWDNLAQIIIFFCFVWLVGMHLVTRKQQKALTQAKEQTQEEEERNRVMAAMKAELEVQVKERTAELTRQKEDLQHALDDLKATQNQLVHAEKMASLGELTAGIAHEIQNPLNFVKNFSEVNAELIAELQHEIEQQNWEEVKALANDISDNEQKITHHGKRADAIVKGMLQHSRSSTGIKEPTDINKLADEYLRLAYHGLRAKDKTFNSGMQSFFDDKLAPVKMIPQDIGRVILNIITNAFYAVNEKKKSSTDSSYQPTVTVSTHAIPASEGGGALIRIADNANGIPKSLLDKIFQPFFTTKPTGQGTGLGLSISYDIVTQGHGGELTVQTAEGIGTTFTITIPA